MMMILCCKQIVCGTGCAGVYMMVEMPSLIIIIVCCLVFGYNVPRFRIAVATRYLSLCIVIVVTFLG